METTQKNADKELVKFIYYKPQSMMRFLSRNGVVLNAKPTRREILHKTFEKLDDKKFVNSLNQMLNAERDENNSNFVVVASIAIAAASLVATGVDQYRKRRLATRVGEADIYANELASYEQSRSIKAAEMDEQIAESVDDYQQTLLQQSTKRQKNAIYIVGAVGAVLLVVLFTKNLWSNGR